MFITKKKPTFYIKRKRTSQEAACLPVHFFLHVRGVAAAIVREQEPSIAQPVDVDLNVGAVHDDHVCGQGLPSYLHRTQTDQKGFSTKCQQL